MSLQGIPMVEAMATVEMARVTGMETLMAGIFSKLPDGMEWALARTTRGGMRARLFLPFGVILSKARARVT